MKKEKKEIEIIVKMPFEDAKEAEIRDDYHVYHDFVGGNIEMIAFPGLKDVSIILNEEGKIFGMEPNIYAPEYMDLLVGPVMFAGTEGESMRSLTENEKQAVNAYIKENDIRKAAEKYTGAAQREI